VESFLEEDETEQGRALYEELLWVHRMIRRDLDTVRQLAADCLEGRAADELQSEIRSLEANGPLWRLKVNCLHYCRFVHTHHRAEDVLLFPRLREANPGIDSVVDRLEADHRKVAIHLEEVEQDARALSDDDGIESRRSLAEALARLADHLLAHLAFEEENVAATMRRLRGI
jgi:hemerythrin superfamily protein